MRDFLIAAVVVLLILAPAHLDGIGAAVAAAAVFTLPLLLLAAGLASVWAAGLACRRLWRGRPMLELYLGLVVAGFSAVPAYADTGSAIVEAVRPALTDFAVAVILALLALAYRRISAWTGIEIEARHREALQSALANGVRAAMSAGGELDIDGIVNRARGYVEGSVPDALAALKVDHLKLRQLLVPHAAAALGSRA